MDRIFAKIYNKLDAYIFRLFPTIPSSADIYIVEFPKSGITWLSMLLAYCTNESLRIKPSFFNLNLFIPDILKAKKIGLGNEISMQSGIRFIEERCKDIISKLDL